MAIIRPPLKAFKNEKEYHSSGHKTATKHFSFFKKKNIYSAGPAIAIKNI